MMHPHYAKLTEAGKQDPTVDDKNLHHLNDPRLWEFWYAGCISDPRP